MVQLGICLLFDSVKHADIINSEDILADDVERLFHRQMVLIAIAYDLCADEDELRPL